MTRTLVLLVAVLTTSTASAGRPKCDDTTLSAGLSRVAASNELQRPAVASLIVAQACDDPGLEDAVEATLDDNASVLITYGNEEERLWTRVCPGITPEQVTSELAPTGCTVDHLGWSDVHFASSMTAAAMSDDATAAPFQFSPALAAQQVARALTAQTLARSRSAHRQAYLDAMAPVGTDERQERAVRTAFAGLSRPSRSPQAGPVFTSRPTLHDGPRTHDASTLDDTIHPQLPALRACTTSAGHVTVRLHLNRDGSVDQATIQNTTLPAASNCLLDIIRPLQFPEATADGVHDYPLEFQDEGWRQ